jgi:hypothetical protein
VSPSGRGRRVAGAGGALAVLLVPKCPLCLLPLAVATGVALPSRPWLDGLAVAAVAAWLAFVLSTARWLPVKGASVMAAALLLGGRWLLLPWASALGAALVLAVALWTRRRACRSAGVRSTLYTTPASSHSP